MSMADAAIKLAKELQDRDAEIERLKSRVDELQRCDEEWDAALSENSEYEGDEAPWNTMRNEFDTLRTENQRLKQSEARYRQLVIECQGEMKRLESELLEAQAQGAAMRAVIGPFVDAFQKATSSNSVSRSLWNEQMPASYPITIQVTMGDCRAARSQIAHSAKVEGE